MRPQRAPSLAEDYKTAFMGLRAAGQVEEPLFDGVIDLLDALEADGWLLAVATGKSDRGLKHCLDSMASMPASSRCRRPTVIRPSRTRRWSIRRWPTRAPSPQTTIVVGDTSFDMAMAVNAGATGIGAAWGYHEADELMEAGAVAVARAATRCP